ncbi:MAG: hypothetical protein Q9M89_00535 [Persephonella sp.]|nr:hypothetical protein [Persephonella sp.]
MRVSELKSVQNIFGSFLNWKTFLFIVAFSVSLSWIGDGIYEIVKKYLPAYYFVFLLTAGLVIASVLFLYVKHQMNRLGNTDIDVQPKEPDKKRVLILFLSHANDIDSAKNISSFEDFKNVKLNWEISAIAIKHHLPALKEVIVITSDMSAPQFDTFKEMIHRIFPDDVFTINRYENAVDFENVEQVYDSLKEIYRTLKKEKKIKRNADFIVDVTGGQKIPSVAGAIFTLAAEGREFQYVSTRTKKVIGFDVLMVHSSEDGL